MATIADIAFFVCVTVGSQTLKCIFERFILKRPYVTLRMAFYSVIYLYLGRPFCPEIC